MSVSCSTSPGRGTGSRATRRRGDVSWAERPELAHGLYEVASEALPDIPGLEDDDIEPFDDWLAHDMQGAGDRPEATFVALAGEQVVGYAKLALSGTQPTIASTICPRSGERGVVVASRER